MARKQRFSPPMVGGSSLLVIFGILSLTIFALLSLSTVQAHTRLADRATQAVTDYYAADCAAEQVLAQLRAGEATSAEVTRSGDLCSYAVDISETQKLIVAVQMQDDDYTVLRWQAVSTADWKPDTSIQVWDGEPLPGAEQIKN